MKRLINFHKKGGDWRVNFDMKKGQGNKSNAVKGMFQ